MKIIVCGSREFDDFALLTKTLDRLTVKLDKRKLIILSGHGKGTDHSRGADRLGELWAFEHLIPYRRYLPDYGHWATKLGKGKGGKVAPVERNQEMVDDCCKGDGVIAFWDGASRGTADLLARAKKKGLVIRIIRY